MRSADELVATTRTTVAVRAAEALHRSLTIVHAAEAIGSAAPHRSARRRPSANGVADAVAAARLLVRFDAAQARSVLQPLLDGGGPVERLIAAAALAGVAPADQIVPVLRQAAVDDVGGAGDIAVAALGALDDRGSVRALMACALTSRLEERLADRVVYALAKHPRTTDDDLELCLSHAVEDDARNTQLLRAIKDPARRSRLLEEYPASWEGEAAVDRAWGVMELMDAEQRAELRPTVRDIAQIESQLDELLVLASAGREVGDDSSLENVQRFIAAFGGLARSPADAAERAMVRVLRRDDLPTAMLRQAVELLAERQDPGDELLDVAMEVARSSGDEQVLDRALSSMGRIGGERALSHVVSEAGNAERWHAVALALVELCEQRPDGTGSPVARARAFRSGSEPWTWATQSLATILRRQAARVDVEQEQLTALGQVLRATSRLASTDDDLREVTAVVARGMASAVEAGTSLAIGTVAFSGIAATLARDGDVSALERLCWAAIDGRRGSRADGGRTRGFARVALEDLSRMGTAGLQALSVLAASGELALDELDLVLDGVDLATRQLAAVGPAAGARSVRAPAPTGPEAPDPGGAQTGDLGADDQKSERGAASSDARGRARRAGRQRPKRPRGDGFGIGG